MATNKHKMKERMNKREKIILKKKINILKRNKGRKEGRKEGKKNKEDKILVKYE